MFVVKKALPSPPLCDLRVLCVKTNLQPCRGSSTPGTQSRHSSSSHFSLFPLFPLFPTKNENVNLIRSITSALFKKECSPNSLSLNHLRTLLQNTGGGGTPQTQTATQSLPSFSTPSKHATHTNARISSIFMRFRTLLVIPGVGGLPHANLLALFRSSYFDFGLSQDRQCSVTGPFIGCAIAAPVRRDSSRLAFSPKYHFAGRSASSISIRRGLCFNPSACRIIVSWSCRKNFFANIRKIQTGSSKFQAATKSIRQRSRRTGVTVARLENHSFPLRISSVRMFGKTKSMVVVTGSPVYFCSIRYGALFELGVCGLIRNPFGIGSNFFSFS